MNKVEELPKCEPTKLTKPSLVGFVGSGITHLQYLVSKVCDGLNVDVQYVIDNLLDSWDEENICKGSVPPGNCRLIYKFG